ncbi:MAG: type II toxin-antitoxin system HipA family toxin [Gammaproteobacteria bacterium]|nr:type II toxin-antitoxin system HipA family toxin [Gammaproteobacteria bacterium]
MNREAHVYADLNSTPHLVGQLFAHVRRGRESATFEYDDAWLVYDERFALEPALQLGPGPFHTGADKVLFGAIGDSAPDRWGRNLMRRAERRRAAAAGTAPRTLYEIDYLLMVNDEARLGALRFADRAGGPFLATQSHTPVPPLIDLPRLLSAAQRVVDENEDDEDLQLIFAPGSSLGGVRPKASVREANGSLAIAKFPHKDDEWSAVAWEAVSLSLAAKAGIKVTGWRLEKIAGKDVIILGRFDRDGAARIPFLSALSMLGATDNETRSYLEIADALRQHGAQPGDDMRELWRRIVFTVLISNVDDHMRNHGFLYTGTDGWVLSPAYDLNPMPVDVKPRILSTAIDDEDQTASLECAFSVAEYFDLDEEEAQGIAGEVGRVVSQWRAEATRLGISNTECTRMKSAFAHADLEMALGFA